MDKLDFGVVKKAGIAVAHFARICGVSRVSATLYLANRVQPRGLYRERVTQRLNMIENAMAAGRLPLPDSTPRKAKYKATVKALKQ